MGLCWECLGWREVDQMACLVDDSQRNLKKHKAAPRQAARFLGARSRRERAPFVPLALVSFAPSRFANVANVGPVAC